MILDNCTVVWIPSQALVFPSAAALPEFSPGPRCAMAIRTTRDGGEDGIAGSARPSLCDPPRVRTHRVDGGVAGIVLGPRCAPPAPPTPCGDIAGVHPRPVLRDPVPGPVHRRDRGRCRRSSPALVARGTSSTRRLPTSATLPGFVPALVARGHARTSRARRGSRYRVQPRPSFRAANHQVRELPAPRRYRGSLRPSLRVVRDAVSLRPQRSGVAGAWALVGRTSPPGRGRMSGSASPGWTPGMYLLALPGFSPGPRCAWMRVASSQCHSRDVAGFSPGPGCAKIARATNGTMYPRALPGIVPSPRCAGYKEQARRDIDKPALLGDRSRPSLRAAGRTAAAAGNHGRCRGSSSSPRCAYPNVEYRGRTHGGVAGAWIRPWLGSPDAARSAVQGVGVAGFVPGLCCTQWRASRGSGDLDGRCGGWSPRPWLRAVRPAWDDPHAAQAVAGAHPWPWLRGLVPLRERHHLVGIAGRRSRRWLRDGRLSASRYRGFAALPGTIPALIARSRLQIRACRPGPALPGLARPSLRDHRAESAWIWR